MISKKGLKFFGKSEKKKKKKKLLWNLKMISVDVKRE